MREGLTPSIIGLVLGVLAARVLEQFVRSSVFGWGGSGKAAVAIVSVAVLIVAIAAAWLPARRALRIDPVAILRGE
jgi:ABC-type antimicrobial peptide transport system permease subunit